MSSRPRVSAFPKCYIEEISTGAMDLFEWISMSRALDAEGLEIYMPFLRETGDAYLEKVRRAIEDTERVCSLLCYSPDFVHPDPEHRKAELEAQKRAIDVTASLGGACCRVLSGERRPDVARPDGVRWVVENIRRALEHAESRGVILAMENHYKDGFWKYPEFAQKVDVFLEIVEQIDSPCFGVQFDPSNAVIAGADPVELLERVKHRVVSMHASDRYLAPGTSLEDSRQADGTLGYPENLHHGVVGEGLNDYDRIFRVLAGRPEPPPGLSRASGPQAPGSILSWLRSQGILGSAFGRLGSEGNSSASGAEGFQCGVGKDDGEDRWAIPIRSGDARGRHSVTRRRGRSMG